ncbi:MAG TPA: hypothetical protein VH253_00395 [Phycisphaerae bacterium]|nr:hypothetical protein [Phycisphaerae bacterium]
MSRSMPASHFDKVEQITRKADDPLAGCPGCHPLGTAIGAAIGGVIGAALLALAIGAFIPPFFAAIAASIGALVGAFAGTFAGRHVAESLNPSTQEHYFRSHFATRPYVHPGDHFDDFREAYAFGILTRQQHEAETFDEAEPTLHVQWDQEHHRLPWAKACPAVCDAWDHLSPHDADL